MRSLRVLPRGAVQGRPVDAVVVPAARPAAHLVHAAWAAFCARAHLLVLCSGATVPEEAYETVRRRLPAESVTVVPVDAGWRIPHLTLAADEKPWAHLGRVDTSLKRNAGLLVARSLGWKRVLFLDDDVLGFGTVHTRSIENTLADGQGSPEAIGWAVDRFPDNSMVCHAYRQAGGQQDTFIGGGSLAVRVLERTPHFPRVYNEDWLFMLSYILRCRRSLVFAGTLRQEKYDPFAVPEHAAQQEFGDVLAEGLFGLVHAGHPISRARSEDFWRDVLAMRRRLIQAIRDRLAERCPGAEAEAACAALDHAVERNRHLGERPLHLAEWVAAWQGDCDTWAGRLAGTPRAAGTDQALAALELRAAGPTRKPSAARHVPAPVPSRAPASPYPDRSSLESA